MLAVLPKDLSLVPRTHMVAPNYLQLQLQEIWYPLLASANICTNAAYIHTDAGKKKKTLTIIRVKVFLVTKERAIIHF